MRGHCSGRGEGWRQPGRGGRRRGMPALLPLLAFLALPCDASAQIPSTQIILLNGTGSSGVAAVYGQYAFVYPVSQAARGVRVAVPYAPSESGQGVRGVLDGSVAWGGTDLPLSPGEVAAGVRIVPSMVGGVVLAYNLPPLYSYPAPLNLTQEVLVGIWNGTIANWTDPLIVRANPGLQLPGLLDQPIIRIVRNDTASGQTSLFTHALAAMSPAWNATYGIFAAGAGFPGSIIQVPFSDMGTAVLLTDYSICYTDINIASTFNLPVAAVQNRVGNFILPSEPTYEAAAYQAAGTANFSALDNFHVNMVNEAGQRTYPISGFTYIAMRNGNPASCQNAYELVRYAWWIVGPPDQGAPPGTATSAADSVAAAFGFAAVAAFSQPPLLSYREAAEKILAQFQCSNGMYLLSAVQNDIRAQNENTRTRVFLIAFGIMAGVVLALAITLWVYWQRNESRREKKVQSGESARVGIPREAREKSQRELNATINRVALEAAEGEKKAAAKEVGVKLGTGAKTGTGVSWEEPYVVSLSAPAAIPGAAAAGGTVAAFSAAADEEEPDHEDDGTGGGHSPDASAKRAPSGFSTLPAPLPSTRAPPPPVSRTQTAPMSIGKHVRIADDGSPAPHSYQTMLIRSSTGTLRAVVAPVRYQEEVFAPQGGTIPRNPMPRIATMTTSSTAASSSAPSAFLTPPVAAPITVKPRWQRSFGLHVAWVVVRTAMDLVAVLLNWGGLFTLPPGLLLSGFYAALCVVGTLFFVFNMFAAVAGLLYHKKTHVEVDAGAMRGRRRVSIDQMAYIKAELRRLQIICIREIVYRSSLLLREIPLIIVTIVIVSEATYLQSQIILQLGLCANCIALGFKLRSVPITVDDFVAYMDMRDLYRVLKAPALSATRSMSAADMAAANVPSDAVGDEPPAQASFYAVPGDRRGSASMLTKAIMSFGGRELRPDTMPREGGADPTRAASGYVWDGMPPLGIEADIEEADGHVVGEDETGQVLDVVGMDVRGLEVPEPLDGVHGDLGAPESVVTAVDGAAGTALDGQGSAAEPKAESRRADAAGASIT
ncbi:hypothetical protein DFJ74DRAFT_441793 [Hyaloraphidium curvatum]|nr:hypothetical protein DFJ74DRAFT_441793 [Hyaloraphidium curvatum]